MHCLSLPSLVAEGGDDAAAGCVALVGEALRRAGPSQPCVFYLPRLESWALSKVRAACAAEPPARPARPGPLPGPVNAAPLAAVSLH